MITINKIEYTKVEVFNPQNKSLGNVNELECLDLRIQIKTQHVAGYYILYEGDKYYIDENGQFDNFPAELWRETLKYALKLCSH